MSQANAKLYGIKVTRTKHQTSHIVWVGYDPQDPEGREAFIRERCYDPEFDGELLFAPVESDVVVTGPGLYQTDREGGRPFRVAFTHPDGYCYGYFQRQTPGGRWKDGDPRWFYVNGEPFNRTSPTHLVGPMPATPGHEGDDHA